MSFLYPSARTRRLITFYLQVVQVVAIIFGGGVALWWYGKQLEAPYDQKQLDLYFEAGKVAADLAKLDKGSDERRRAEHRFWELYWGELPFVESRSNNQKDDPSMETRMVRLCVAAFDEERCQKKPAVATSLEACAIRLSRSASQEIQEHWKPWRRWIRYGVHVAQLIRLVKASEEPELCPEPPKPAAAPGPVISGNSKLQELPVIGH